MQDVYLVLKLILTIQKKGKMSSSWNVTKRTCSVWSRTIGYSQGGDPCYET
jgi:hypothetical protein